MATPAATHTLSRMGVVADQEPGGNWSVYGLSYDARTTIEVPFGADAGLQVSKLQSTEALKFTGWRLAGSELLTVTSAEIDGKSSSGQTSWEEPTISALGADTFLVMRWVGGSNYLNSWAKVWLVKIGADATPQILDSQEIQDAPIYDPYVQALVWFTSDSGVYTATKLPVSTSSFGAAEALPTPVPDASWGAQPVIDASMGLTGSELLVFTSDSHYGIYTYATGAITAIADVPDGIAGGVGPLLGQGDNGTTYINEPSKFLDSAYDRFRVCWVSVDGWAAEPHPNPGSTTDYSWDFPLPEDVVGDDWYRYRTFFSGTECRMAHVENIVVIPPPKIYTSAEDWYNDNPIYQPTWPTYADFEPWMIANYGSEQGFLDGWANVPTTATEGYVVGLVEGVGEPMWAVFDQSDFTDESGTWSSTGSMKPFARTSKGWLTYTPEYNSATSQTRMAVYLWSPKSADDAQQIRWWDGEQVQYATLRGWWDGEAEQPLLVNGWWDGSDVLPILEGSA